MTTNLERPLFRLRVPKPPHQEIEVRRHREVGNLSWADASLRVTEATEGRLKLSLVLSLIELKRANLI